MSPCSLQFRCSLAGGWFAAFLVVGALGPTALAQVVINELLADNQGIVADADRSPDYIELFNRGDTVLDLSGWSLTDDPAQPRRFVFPSGTLIPAQGRLLVWCDSQLGAPGLRTGFGLSTSGDQVRLMASDGVTVVDDVTFGLQVQDIALGRVPDGVGPWVLNHPTPLDDNRPHAVLEDSRGLRINEWMSRPATGEDWLELFNPGTLPAPLGGLVLTDSLRTPPDNRSIPNLSFIAAGGFRQFFASDLRQPDADHLDFQLSVNGETLTLYAPDRVTLLDRVTFGPQVNNVSQGRVPDGADTITSFTGTPSTPGESNGAPVASIVINEVLSHADPPFEDAIELHNPSSQPVDISHWWLSDSLNQPKKFPIPPGTLIAAGGFAVFYDYQFGAGTDGFSLNSAEGDRVVLSAAGADGELTGQQLGVSFGPAGNGVPLGRVETSTGFDFVPLSTPTFGVPEPRSLAEFRLGTGAPNSPPRQSPVVIHEFHFRPDPDAPGSEEFIELHNPTALTVPLFDPAAPTNTWKLADGVTFAFPFNIQLAPRAFALVFGFDPAIATDRLDAFRLRYSVPDSVPVFGPYQGNLSDTGESLELLRPDEPEGPDDPNAGLVPYLTQEEIHYSHLSPWPADAAGQDQSFQRLHATAYANDPVNWYAAPPTPGRANSQGPDPTVDVDADGLPDTWELAHGLNPQDPTDAEDDPDADGQSNRSEFLSGTHPRDPASSLRITRVEVTFGLWRIEFLAVASRTYTVEFLPIPSQDAAWLPIATSAPADQDGSRQVSGFPPAGQGGLLRISIQP